MAGLGPGFAGLLSNNVLLQILLYNVAGQLVGAALTPYATALSQELLRERPVVALTPAELAGLVIRSELSEDAAAGEAAMTGVNAERFHLLTRLAGQAPGPMDLAVGLRRKLIDPATFLRGIEQGNLRNEWADLVRELAVQQPSPVAMLEAYLEGQLSEGEARDRYQQLGGDPAYFDILYNTQGQAPTPVQALDMLNRGLIPEGGEGPGVTSYRQAFLEGPWRNKWLGPFLGLRHYLPPPRTVTAMYREGSYTREQAAARYKANGLTDEDTAAYLASGSSQATTTTKELGQATITALYRDRIITRDQAAGFIGALGYSSEEATYILEVEDLRLVQRFLESAVGRVHSLYVGHRISQEVASSTLAQLGVDAGGIPDLLKLWGYERAANVKLLTPADIANARKKKLLDDADAMAELEAMGYLPHDAWTYLAVRIDGWAAPEPPRGGGITGG